MRHLLALALLASPLLANGTIEVRGDRAGSVALTKHAVTAVLRDQLAEVTVEQAFVSHGTRRAEGVYVFALPRGASVSAFEMTADGKTMKGEVIERQKAKQIYEEIVASKRDPALLEKIDDEKFRARVFPIDPEKTVVIRLTYQQLLDDHDGAIEFRYPLDKTRLGAADVAQVEIKVEVESSIDLVGVSSPTRAAKIEAAKRRATLLLAGGADVQADDLLVHVRRDPKAIGFTLLGDAASRTFLAILSPPTRLPDEAIPSRDLVYVLDTSGSMKGDKLAQAKAALKRGVTLLRVRDRFRILAFSTEVRPFRDGWLDATDANKEAALAWIDGLEATGGTAIDDALKEALAAGDPNRLTLVVFLTDGLPTVGEQDPKKIVANVRAKNGAAMRIFCFGVGFDQGVPLLDEVALSTRASREYVTEKQDLEAVLGRFFDRVQQPALSDLRMEWGSGAREIYPHPLPDLFAGDRLVIVGRYETAGPRAVKLLGTRLGEPFEQVYEGSLPETGGVPAVARLWAQRKIDFLLSEIARNGPNKELKDEIVSLAVKHHIVTAYTAGLVVEDEPRLPAETVMEENEVDTDSEFEETAGEDGLADRPFTGPEPGSAIGLGGGGGAGRRDRGGSRRLRAGGGTELTENAVEHGLRWLASKQNADTGAIGSAEDTSLALLAMLGAGYTDRGSERENKHAKCVRMGLRFLLMSQDDMGSFVDQAQPGWLQAHAIATVAVAEAFWMTRNPRYKKPAQDGLYLLARVRNALGGWGDGSGAAEEDTLTTIWAISAFQRGKYAGLEVDPDAFEGTRKMLDARLNSLKPAEQAAAIWARIIMGEDPQKSEALRPLADALVARKPVWRDGEDPPLDLWYFGTLALFQHGGPRWREWNEAMRDVIVTRQRPKDSDLVGTWPTRPGQPLIRDQAKLALCLEVYYRYDRVFGVK